MTFVLSGPIIDDQLFLDFEIAIPVSVGTPSSWTKVRGLIDTGAQASHLHPSIIDTLKIPKTGDCRINSLDWYSTHRTETRWFSTSSGETKCQILHMARQLPSPPDNFQSLIGMDFIKSFNFQIFEGKSFSLSLPVGK